MLAWCPQPQCSQLKPTSQRCLELLAGAALDPSSGLSSTAPRAARGSAGPSGSGWQLAGTEPAGRDREAVARTCFPVPPPPTGMAQNPWRQGHGDPQEYLSGAVARAAVALGRRAQPGHPPAGSAAGPGPAPRRSDPSSVAPPCPESPRPARPWAPCHQGHPGTPVSPHLCRFSLASERFISSISARVGALSRTRGRGRAGTALAGQRDSSRQELELRRPAQACGMQGKELYPAEGRAQRHGDGHTGDTAQRGGDLGTFLLHGPELPLLPDLLQDLLMERPLLLGQRPQPPL